MPPNNEISLGREQESSSHIECRAQRFRLLQSTAEYIGVLVYKLVDWFTRRGCFLKLEVKGSADGWALVLSFELR